MKSWSSTQAVVALSSGEAELYALVKASSEGLGFQSIARDLGWSMPIRVHIDSSAAKSASSRLGLGKLRHVDVKHLWIQESVAAGRISLHKIRGDENPADVLTKPQSGEKMAGLLARVGGVLELRPRQPKWADVVDHPDDDLHGWATGAFMGAGRGGVLAVGHPSRSHFG